MSRFRADCCLLFGDCRDAGLRLRAEDSDSERAVQSALLEIAKGRTTIVIAHRLSAIRHANRIVVLTDGGIAE